MTPVAAEAQHSQGSRVPAAVPADPLDLIPSGAVVAVAMSGGVDSSVAAARCVERGIRTIGITLAMWPRTQETARDRGCCSVDAVEDARRVCTRLGIPHYPWNLEEEFRRAVIADFEAEYAAGRTPNPCIRCNREIKFGVLLERARAVGATHVATGHYAQVGRRDGRWTLHRGADLAKDQAYTLHQLRQEQLGAAVFPVGRFSAKTMVRAEAVRLGLGTAAKPDSQELCFVEGSVRDDLEHRLEGRFQPGKIVNQQGDTLGEHRGLPFYTVGQRAGLNLPALGTATKPRYVIALRPQDNAVVVGARSALQTETISAEQCHWIGGEPPPVGQPCEVQLRAHGKPAAAIMAESGSRCRVRFASPVEQVAAGQSLVLFAGDEILGGGLVTRDTS